MELSTGSTELDALIEELQPRDNVVFFTDQREDYAPFVLALVRHAVRSGRRLIYVSADGYLDGVVSEHPSPMRLSLDGSDWQALMSRMAEIGGDAYYVFDSLAAFEPLVGGEAALRELFLTLCPRLFELRSVAYWDLEQRHFPPSTVAAIRDCTQVFIRVDRHQNEGWVITPQKVWGRYSDAMFQPHLARWRWDGLHVTPVEFEALQDARYLNALAGKNRELAEIRDMLSRRNDELAQRNTELALLNSQVQEQSRLYESLRSNLDHLTWLFQVGWDIGGSLVHAQVYDAILTGCARLFAGADCRLVLSHGQGEPVDMEWGVPGLAGVLARTDAGVAAERALAMHTQHTASLSLDLGTAGTGSVALASITIRGRCVGTLEVYADDGRLADQETRMLLGYLASEGGIALDNADLYHETDLQREQLRGFVGNVIRSEERESRQLALDLHDGLVQMIVGSYQHFQAAQAWHGRDGAVEQTELGKGIQILRDAISEARRLISQLRPAGLDDFGLEQALRVYLGEVRDMAPWEVTLSVEGSMPALSPEAESALFRIVQEATMNALHHAQASDLSVSLAWQGHELVLVVSDTGRGFDPSAVVSQPEKGLHVGLVGIRERARLLGGACWIDSAPGAGTRITVTIPAARVLDSREQAL